LRSGRRSRRKTTCTPLERWSLGAASGILEDAHGVHPRARRVHHAARTHAEAGARSIRPTGFGAAGLHAAGRAPFAQDRSYRRARDHGGAVARGRAQVGEHEARVVGQVLAEDAGIGVDGAIEDGLAARELLTRPVAVAVRVLHLPELLVGRKRRTQLRKPRPRAGRHHHPVGLGQMGRDAVEDLALKRHGADRGDVAEREVAQASVDELRGAARCARGEVARLEQGHAQAAASSFAGDAGACDASTDHDQVEALGLEPRDTGFALAAAQRGRRHRRSVTAGSGPKTAGQAPAKALQGRADAPRPLREEAAGRDRPARSRWPLPAATRACAASTTPCAPVWGRPWPSCGARTSTATCAASRRNAMDALICFVLSRQWSQRSPARIAIELIKLVDDRVGKGGTPGRLLVCVDRANSLMAGSRIGVR
jgi:hypothetical protein